MTEFEEKLLAEVRRLRGAIETAQVWLYVGMLTAAMIIGTATCTGGR